MKLSRRAFITSAALAPVACGVPLSYERGTPVAQPKPLPAVRPPEVGQEWSYIKRNVFDGKIWGLLLSALLQLGQQLWSSALTKMVESLPMKCRVRGEW